MGKFSVESAIKVMLVNGYTVQEARSKVIPNYDKIVKEFRSTNNPVRSVQTVIATQAPLRA